MHIISHISWDTYFTITILVLTVYYPWMAIQFYKDRLSSIWARITCAVNRECAGRPVQPGLPATTPDHGTLDAGLTGSSQTAAADPPVVAGLFVAIEHLAIQLANGANHPSAVVAHFRTLLSGYNDPGLLPLRHRVNKAIVGACNYYGLAGISEQEVANWWSD